jgi:hypothetical protein
MVDDVIRLVALASKYPAIRKAEKQKFLLD